jgi:hypothetical protein
MRRYEVFTVTHTMSRGKTHGTYLSDLIFVDGSPVIVLEWGGSPDNEQPLVTLALDQSRLSKVSKTRPEYLYDGPLEGPRTMN